MSIDSPRPEAGRPHTLILAAHLGLRCCPTAAPWRATRPSPMSTLSSEFAGLDLSPAARARVEASLRKLGAFRQEGQA